MNTTFDYHDRVALVTGAGSGIGRASAQAFADSGATVVVADINEAGGTETVALIEAAGGRAEFVSVDVADETGVNDLVNGIVERHGRLDFAHNNAGIEATNVPLAELSSDEWRHVIDVDLTSVFYCLKAEIPQMVEAGGGAIVNTASVSGLIGGYTLACYTAAKHAVVGLTKAAAMDYATQNIRINAICPGLIDTPFIAALPRPAIDRLLLSTPIGRMGRPEEMAQAVLWLCSDSGSYMLGHALAVDGGVALGGTGTRFDDLF
ncbi:glucose 1-dehydrogenase [Diaminobutyricibacter sp. McL0618]|uniref:glucose 1-dehydrogenase n=1 Tax=Leifsonia sp. McL0618 TaxID=3415677 RepID=UPI003CF6A600